ncbi:hypothetical protein BN1708_010270 [Verticillium longisporum]|uniref:Uncharacterized protein n=1 Tax=Verticillium longisporum TaxID=100787 RepID=A0A0G4KPR3_VERLO|nr:hypothetical protein BN1708_010270 [Verticillium longisporum]
MSSKKIAEFPDVEAKLQKPTKQSAFEKQRAEAEAKRAREAAETAAVLREFEASFDDDDDNGRDGHGGGGGRYGASSQQGGPGRGPTGGSGGFGGPPAASRRHFGASALKSGPGSLGPVPPKSGPGSLGFAPKDVEGEPMEDDVEGEPMEDDVEGEPMEDDIDGERRDTAALEASFQAGGNAQVIPTGSWPGRKRMRAVDMFAESGDSD